MAENEQPLKKKSPFDMVAPFLADESSQETYGWIVMIDQEIIQQNGLLEQVAETYKNLPMASLGGYAAEAYETATFNVDAVVQQTGETVTRLASNAKNSPDMVGSWGEEYSSKFNQDPVKTLYEQSKASPGDVHGPSRYDQMERLVPADQLDKAKEIAALKAEQYSQTNPDLAARYEEAGNKLTDRITSPGGAESRPLTKEEADNQALEIKNGNIPEITYDESVTFEDCLAEIGQAAGGAALVSASLHLVPVVARSMKQLAKDPNYGTKEFLDELHKWAGDKGMVASFDTFVKSFVSSSLTVANRVGALEGPLQDCHPSVYAGVAIVSIEATKKFYLCAQGKCTVDEAVDHVLRSGIKTTATLTGKVAGQVIIPIPIVGGIIGAFLGTIAGEMGIDSIENSTAIQIMRAMNQHYSTHKVILSRMFETGAKYQEIHEAYEKAILETQKTADLQKKSLELNDKMVTTEREVVQEANSTIEILEKNRAIIEEFMRRKEA